MGTLNNDVKTFSSAEFSFTQRLVSECATYLLELAWTLPDLRIQIEQGKIEREFQIINLVKEILSRLPEQIAGGQDTPSDESDFELKYRRSMALLLDDLELFGIRLSRHIRRYNLSIAYINLGLSTTDTSIITSGSTRKEKSIRESGAGTATSEVLVKCPRLLIRGEPGSGKTTLLQWIAVQAARHSTEADPAWRELVPFVVWLRRYAQQQYPSPAQMVAHTCPNVSEEMPVGWASRVLRNGRGLILIDGVDELPEDKRDGLLAWLERLTNDYPNSRIIITSRAVSVDSDWLDALRFESAEIQPMNRSRIPVFLAHWHRAIASVIRNEDEKPAIERMERALKSVLNEHRELQSLAQSPLFCAMLCAMNLQVDGKLPRNRMELYRTALNMLLERRDLEREIAYGRELTLSRDDKEALVAQLAYWMFANNLISVPRTRIISRIESIIKKMPHVEGKPEDILWYIHHRSGLLRETVLGHFDFTHLTFQECLAAREATLEDDIDLLVSQGSSPRWHNVVLFAAGHCTHEQRERLLDGLLSRGENEQQFRGQLFLLAVSCRETSTLLPVDIQKRLGLAIGELVPPKDNEEAKLLAQGGKLAIPYLREIGRWNDTYTPFIIRALGQIDDEQCMSLIAKYATGKGESVIDAVMDVWGYFDYKSFGEQVVKQMGFTGWFVFSGYVNEADGIYLCEITRCTVKNVDNVKDLMFLRNMRNLITLDIVGCDKLESLKGIGKLSQLERLHIQSCSAFVDAGAAKSLRKLHEFTIAGCGDLKSLEFMRMLRALQSVELVGLEYIESFAPLGVLNCLTHLSIKNCAGLSDISWIRFLKRLQLLDLDGCYSIKNIEYVERLPELTRLMVADNSIRDKLSIDFQYRVEVE